MDETINFSQIGDLGDETPIIGDNRGVVDFVERFAMGATPLLGWGLLGTLDQLVHGPGDFQVPLIFGFTISTPASSDPLYYTAGGLQRDRYLQYEAQRAGQPVPYFTDVAQFFLGSGFQVRTHTTGLLDAGTRLGYPGAYAAEELVHPGRGDHILGEEYISERGIRFPLGFPIFHENQFSALTAPFSPVGANHGYGGMASPEFEYGTIASFASTRKRASRRWYDSFT